MKKLMVAACAALCATVGFSEEAAVQSANIVGYTTKKVPAGKFMILACQFNTAAGVQTMNVQDAFKCDKPGVAWNGDDLRTGWKTECPCIQIPKGNQTSTAGYAIYYYVSDAYDEAHDCDVQGWADDEGYLVTSVTVKNGTAVWMRANSAEDSTFTCAGGVADDSTKVTANTGFSLKACTIPVGYDINSAKITWGLTPGQAWNGDDLRTGWKTECPVIQIPKGDKTSTAGYAIYYYVKDAYDEANDCDVQGWADDEGYLVKGVKLVENQGFWIKSLGEFTMSFAQ